MQMQNSAAKTKAVLVTGLLIVIAGTLTFCLPPTVASADGIEVIAPNRPFYPLGHETVAQRAGSSPTSLIATTATR